ncbi:hypothetical protein ACFLPV_004440 [Serratia marcescens]|uniref:hypothetical protein n=1 Tax=unclassified Serratia (in: enterobacteria) TaxID=2647522 RepID=UPI0024AF9AF3|nr:MULTISPECIES: hypothetical protein [unclassified Serratia (in: enterobacteria)]EMB6256479.1 hypothetical protein [Serratia marcescens]MDI6974890.1 hypothetical protein [Serratia sp. Se-RSBMAAmG]MDI9264128.1 hypothetical protein [Serratia sp. PF2-63]MDI9269836.1 hypothetical protein [Serratia sp. PF-27]
MKTLMKGLFCCALAAPFMAQAETGTWASGWGQGTTEYSVRGQGQSQLYIGCDPYKAMFVMFTDTAGRSLTHYDAQTQTRSFYVSVDGSDPIPFNDVLSRVGADSVRFAWDKLRKGKTVVVSGEGMQTTRFTLKGAGQVLPAFPQSDCKVGAAIPAGEN